MRLPPLFAAALLVGACAALTTPPQPTRPAGVTLTGRVLPPGGPVYGLRVLEQPLPLPTPMVPAVQPDAIATVEVWIQSAAAAFPSESPGECVGAVGAYATTYPTTGPIAQPTAYETTLYEWPTTAPTAPATSYATTRPTYWPTTAVTTFPTLGPTVAPTVLPTPNPSPSFGSPPPDATRIQALSFSGGPLTYTVSGLAPDRHYRVVVRAISKAEVELSCPGHSQVAFDTFPVNGAYPTTLSRDVKLVLLKDPTYIGQARLGFDVRPGGIASTAGPPRVGVVSTVCPSPLEPSIDPSVLLVDPVLVYYGTPFVGTPTLTDRRHVGHCTLAEGGPRCAYFMGRMAELDVYSCPY